MIFSSVPKGITYLYARLTLAQLRASQNHDLALALDIFSNTPISHNRMNNAVPPITKKR